MIDLRRLYDLCPKCGSEFYGVTYTGGPAKLYSSFCMNCELQKSTRRLIEGLLLLRFRRYMEDGMFGRREHEEVKP
jgi:hypothetical protein